MSGTIINDKLEGNAEGNLQDYGATTILRYVTEGETVFLHIMFSVEEYGKWQVSFSHLSLYNQRDCKFNKQDNACGIKYFNRRIL